MMMGFGSGLSFRPSLTRDILRFLIVRVLSRLPRLGSSVMVAMRYFVSLVASCLLVANYVYQKEGWQAQIVCRFLSTQ